MWLIVGVLILAILGALLLFGNMPEKTGSRAKSKGKNSEITISVNQQEVQIPKGSDLAFLLASLETSVTHGSLLDIEGKFLEAGGGEAGSFNVNGDFASLDKVLKKGDSVKVIPGNDTVEQTRPSQILYGRSPLISTIKGPVYVVTERGKNNEDLYTRGVVSGKKRLEKKADGLITPTKIEGRRYISSSKKIVALTFDDGPNAVYTPQVLDVLKAEKVKATFFTLAPLVERYPDLSKRIVEEGHQIAIHGSAHKRYAELWPDDIRYDVNDAIARVEKVTGKKSNWVRPPYGSIDGTSMTVLSEMGVNIAMWDVDTKDWKLPGFEQIAQTGGTAFEGSVVLMHDGGVDRTQTVQALPVMIQMLKSRGFTFVSMDEYGILLGL